MWLLKKDKNNRNLYDELPLLDGIDVPNKTNIVCKSSIKVFYSYIYEHYLIITSGISF